MRKKLQDKMFELSYILELFISLMVGVSVIILGVYTVFEMTKPEFYGEGIESLVTIFDKAIALAIGAELIKMLCKHTPETIIEVLAFALARHLIIGHVEAWENLITILAIAVLFAIRKFLLKRHDMVETPDGLVELGKKE